MSNESEDSISRKAFQKWIQDNNVLFVTKWAWAMWQAAESHAKGQPIKPWNDTAKQSEKSLAELLAKELIDK